MPMGFLLLVYQLSPDYLERRQAFRSVHLNLANQFANDGYLMMAGALDAPADFAYLIFKTDSKAIPQSFVDSDPYVKEGLILNYEIRKWNVAAGFMV
jgi:uncharacterized protein